MPSQLLGLGKVLLFDRQISFVFLLMDFAQTDHFIEQWLGIDHMPYEEFYEQGVLGRTQLYGFEYPPLQLLRARLGGSIDLLIWLIRLFHSPVPDQRTLLKQG